VHFFDSNAGSRIAGLVAASVALAAAGIPMRDLVAGVAVGRANGELLVDLTKEEEDAEDAVDMPIAMMPNLNRVVLMQMDGMLSKEEFKKLFGMAKKAIRKVYEIEKEALENFLMK